VAWLNASIASGQDEERPQLYRTISVEFFPAGVQLVGCDGTMLFRTWAPYSDIGDLPADPPTIDEAPEDAIVVMDRDKFAVGFMRTLLSACGDIPVELTFTVEQANDEDEPSLSDELAGHVLTMTALGQRLSCKLFDGRYPDWRELEFGMTEVERVEGMTLATRLFSAVGKLRGVAGIDCEFRGEDKAITFTADARSSTAHISGMLMPMRRPDKPKEASKDAAQIAHA
jgi:hypothetical protein